MATESPQPHVVIFPAMAQGHAIPLQDLSRELSRRGLKITIIATPANAQYFIRSTATKKHHPEIALSVIPFPRVEGLPEGCENAADLPSPDLLVRFTLATKRLKEPFERVFGEMIQSGSPPVCLITDVFLPWTIDSCRSFGIPRLLCHGGGVLPAVIVRAFNSDPGAQAASDSEPLQFPGVKAPFTFTRADLPEYRDPHATYNAENPFSRFMAELKEAADDCWGYIYNSFEELEGEYVSAFERSFSKKGTNAWCLGPLHLFNELEQAVRSGVDDKDQSCSYIKWLNEQDDGPNSVIYVSFGSTLHVSDAQMDEIAFGLEMAGHPFLWVSRSKKWNPPIGWEERVKGRGLVLNDWVDQRSILNHPSTGGFLTHCGWNSVMESLSLGIPLLAWPMGLDHFLTAKYIAEGIGSGIQVPQGRAGGRNITVQRDVIRDGVRELMGGEKGRKARERAQAFGVVAKQAVGKGGSSDKKLDELIHLLTRKEKEYVKG